MEGNFLTDVEQNGGKSNVVLEKDVENTMNEICEQEGSFNVNCSKRDTCT